MSVSWKERRRRWRGMALGWLLDRLADGVEGLPWPRVQARGRRIGDWFCRLSRVERRRALQHLEMAFPDQTGSEREAVARECFRNQGVNLFELLHLWRLDRDGLRSWRDRWLSVQGWESVEAVRESGRATMIVTGHCGNWEVLAHAINAEGLPLAPVGREMQAGPLQARLLEIRRHLGSETVVRGAPGSARLLLRTLRGGGGLGLLIDQDPRVDRVWVPFFGRPAYTPVGAAELAAKHGAAAVPAFIERRPDGSHAARFEPEVELPDDATEATALLTARIEAQIRRVPEQWVWMHRRWRRQPEG